MSPDGVGLGEVGLGARVVRVGARSSEVVACDEGRGVATRGREIVEPCVRDSGVIGVWKVARVGAGDFCFKDFVCGLELSRVWVRLCVLGWGRVWGVGEGVVACAGALAVSGMVEAGDPSWLSKSIRTSG